MRRKRCNLKETRKLAGDIACGLLESPSKNTATVVALFGDLGGGKTTFTKALAKELGVSETIVSPTFVIMKTYPIRTDGRKARPTSNGTNTPNAKRYTFLFHLDAYRLDSADELRAIGWDEILSKPENLIVIEWPERVKRLIPKAALRIKFKFIDDKTREISWK